MSNKIQEKHLYLSEIKDERQKILINKMKDEYLTTGKFAKDQTVVSPKIMSSLIAVSGLGLTSISADLSGILFMATANPATLMRIGIGVGSAQMGATGIIAQAPFIPIASSLPVVGPIIAMQALSSIVILQQFNALHKKLDSIRESIDKVLIRQEATIVGELFSAVSITDEIYEQYSKSGSFSTDMLVRLALTERDAIRLSVRYNILENMQDDNNTNSDIYLMVLASFLHLRVKYLRTCVNLQENPSFMKHSSESFKETLHDNLSLWNKLIRRPAEIKSEIDKIEKRLEVGKIQQMARKITLDKELTKLKDEYTSSLSLVNNIQSDFYQLIEDVKKMVETDSENQEMPTLLYWKDEDGTHCIATNELFAA
ncbi:hypothetical protein FACS1894132_11150 [Clostridia bacterium]|nr:hypothetical protein FACS1894132_11150 [Clostridia bacterium]